MYKVKCDGYPLLDLRDERFILVNPKVKVETNKIGEGSFTIYKKHPNYGKLQKLKSGFEVADEIGVIFRGRMTENTRDFNNGKFVDLEGAMGFFNDSIVPSFKFPEDFLENADYITESTSGNVVRFFLKWLIDNHNSQVQDFQKFKLGNVTVSDPNNYITRASSDLPKTWEILKSKLFDSELGGHLCIRYEDDGNYIDYLSEFTLTNTQDIEFGVNLLDLLHDEDAKETYSAIVPIGAEIDVETEELNDYGDPITVKKKVTLESIADGAITDDIYKITLSNGLHALYSKTALEQYGWIVAPVSETTWSDVTEVNNLLTKGSEWLATLGIMWKDTVEITAVDLHLTDEEIRSFRIYRKINVKSKPHEIENAFDLTKLDIDLLNPQNTKITVGETKLTLIDQNKQEHADNITKVEEIIKDVEENRTETTEVKNQLLIQRTEVINTCTEIILAASEQFVEKGNYDEFRQTVESQLKILSDQISLNFTETTTEIKNVNGDLQETNTTLSKYFEFTLDGLVIKSGESSITLHIDNDMIMFKRNGVMFGWWDGVDFHTGNIVVEVNERAQFGNFAFVPRSDGSLSFLKVDNSVLTNKLIAISVKYSGGDVKVGTNVSALKGIVVTATYSDGSTEDVTDYTISGTIGEGSNIITVTYGEKTARFSVNGISESVSYTWTKYAIVSTYNTVEEPLSGIPSDYVAASGTSYWHNSYTIDENGYFQLSEDTSILSGYASIKNGDGRSIYARKWSMQGGSSTTTYSKITITESTTAKGEEIGTVTSANINDYPSDGIKDGYWYVLK